jgi:acetylornithine deacetylase
MNPALVVSGGDGAGTLPGTASFMSDIRVIPGMTRSQVGDDIARLLDEAARQDPELDATFAIEHWHPPCEIDVEHPVVAAIQAATREVLGSAPPFGAFPGGPDGPFFDLVAGIPTVPSFGPGLLTAAHRPNESISVRSIEQATEIYARIAAEFLA